MFYTIILYKEAKSGKWFHLPKNSVNLFGDGKAYKEKRFDIIIGRKRVPDF